MTSYGSERLADYIIIVRGAVRVVRIVVHSENGAFGTETAQLRRGSFRYSRITLGDAGVNGGPADARGPPQEAGGLPGAAATITAISGLAGV